MSRWPKTIVFGRTGTAFEKGRKTRLPQGEIAIGFFGPSLRRDPNPFRVGLYARVSTHDQQTIPSQTRAMREYAVRHGRTISR